MSPESMASYHKEERDSAVSAMIVSLLHDKSFMIYRQRDPVDKTLSHWVVVDEDALPRKGSTGNTLEEAFLKAFPQELWIGSLD